MRVRGKFDMIKKVKKPISLLELGAGSAGRLSSLRAKKGRIVIGIDKDRKKAWHQRKGIRVKRKVPGVRLVYGKKGQVELFLRNLISRGRKVKVINAEYFFANLGEQFPFPEAYYENIQIANRESKKILELVKRVLIPNGRIRLQTPKFDATRWKKILGESGFVVTSVSKVPEGKVSSWYEKEHLRKSKTGNPDFEPTQIIARMAE